MTLQARLTLWAIFFTAGLVGLVSAVDLSLQIERQFAATRESAALIRQVAGESVRQAAERERAGVPAGIPAMQAEAPRLSRQLMAAMNAMKPLVEIAVCDEGGRIVGDSYARRVGESCPELPKWSDVVKRSNWFDKMSLLWGDTGSYEIREPVRDAGAAGRLQLVMVLRPQIIRDELQPDLNNHVWISGVSILGAMLAAFLFSTFAFRPLGKLGKLVDLIARGEYELPVESEKKESQDEFKIVASKVTMLGQQLRGAHAEFSDLKTNVERLLEELEDAVLIFTRERRLIAAAGSVEKFLGRPRNSLLNQTINDIFPPGTALGLFLSQAVQTGRTLRNRRVPLSGVEGEGASLPFALLSVEFLESSAAGGMLVRLRDPEATRQIGRQLQTADRLSAISRLTKGVAHEVKNPLNAMLMHVELARMKLAHGDFDLEPQMDIITSEIMRLDRVVKTFLDFTRPVQLNLSEVRLGDFVEEIAGLARPQATASGIAVVEKIEVEDAMVSVDVDLLKQAVFNIVVNALEAMPNGGTLRLEASLRGDDAEVRIVDTGNGIPAEVKEKIYDLYFTTKQSGSGIGLAMTFRIVQMHDGTIDFVSEAGHGTTFVVRLPVSVLSA